MEDIHILLDTLGDKDSAWVDRRDAAEKVGKEVQQVIARLSLHLQDEDMDVKMAVERSLEPVHLLLRTRDKERKDFSLRDLAFFCEKSGVRSVKPYKTGFIIKVRLPNGRKQRVYLMPHQLRDGRKILRVLSVCCEANNTNVPKALRTNSRLAHSAFSLIKSKDVIYISILSNIFRQEATPDRIKRTVKEVAYYADWMTHLNDPTDGDEESEFDQEQD